jgi:nuclease A inhibitor-like protein
MAEIEKAASGLLLQSESDYPLQPFIWPSEESFSLERLLKLKKYPTGTPVETLGMDQFFRHAIAEQDWHGPAEQESTRRFRALVATLKEHLRDIAVYKIGEINIAVYIIGHTKDGKYAGLSTKVVET